MDNSLGPDDSYIVIKFNGIGSAQFTLYPSNIVPAQMLGAAEILKWQAERQMEDEWERRKIQTASILPLNAK